MEERERESKRKRECVCERERDRMCDTHNRKIGRLYFDVHMNYINLITFISNLIFPFTFPNLSCSFCFSRYLSHSIDFSLPLRSFSLSQNSLSFRSLIFHETKKNNVPTVLYIMQTMFETKAFLADYLKYKCFASTSSSAASAAATVLLCVCLWQTKKMPMPQCCIPKSDCCKFNTKWIKLFWLTSCAWIYVHGNSTRSSS